MALLDAVSGTLNAAGNLAKILADKIDSRTEKLKPYTPTADEVRILKLMEEPRKVRQLTLETFEPLWSKCILYTMGMQHLRYMGTGRIWTHRKAEDWMPLPVVNHIQPKVQRVVDFFTRKRPTAYVEPNSRRETDIDAAELAEAVLEHLWALNGEDDNLDEAATWLVTTGNCFSKAYIDITARTASNVPMIMESEEPMVGADGMPIVGLDGMPVMSKRYVQQRDEAGAPMHHQIPQGDVASEITSPLAMTVPFAARRAQVGFAPWIMETQLQPTEVLRQMFPEKADFIPEKGKILTSDLYTQRLSSLLSSGMHGIARTVDPYFMEGYAVVNSLEVAPTVENPEGILLIEMDGLPLWYGGLPLKTRFSYEHSGYYRVPGRFWFRGMVEDLIHPQDQINKLEQYLQLNDAFNVNPQWVVATEAQIAEGALRNKPGNVVQYQYPHKPERISGEAMPAQIVQRRAMYQQDIEDISGARNVLIGKAPPGVTAGVALNRLGEEAEGMFDPIAKRFDRFIERREQVKLELVQAFYSEPRFMAIETDGGNVVEIEDFKGSDLRGNTKVRIEAGSYQPRSKAGMQQMLFDAYDKGLFPNLFADPGQYAEFMDQLGISGFFTEQGLDYKRAKWENEMLARSEGFEQVFRRSGDDDLIHLSVHTSFRKTKAFLRLPNMVQNRFLIHEMDHLRAIIEAEGQSEPPKADAEFEKESAGGGSGAGDPAAEPGAVEEDTPPALGDEGGSSDA